MAKRFVITVLILTVAAVVPHDASVKELLAQSIGHKQLEKYSGDSSAGEWFETSGGGDEVREEFHQTYPLSPTGRVLLENLNGGVKISVWDRNEVQVDAVKRAYNRERLAEATIEINASPDSVRIRTRYPGRNQIFTDNEKGRYNNPAIVDYAVSVPRQARLESIELVNGSLEITGVEGDVKASSVNGKVVARGLMGEARLTTVNGNLEATFSRLDESKPISLGSVNGNVSLTIPSNSNAVVRANTVHGGITNEFGLEVTHGNYVGHELYGQIGTGGPRIKLGNVNGGIQIRHSQDGAGISPSTNLTATKEKARDGDEDDSDIAEAARELSEASGEIAEAAAVAVREGLAEARVEREAQREARREADRALAEAQREIQRAQIEVQRELREQLRNEGRGTGTGVGRGVGSSHRVTDRDSKSFPVSGTPRVNVSTFDGNVSVHGWDKAEVMYTVIRRANTSEALKSIDLKAEQQGSLVSIIAQQREGSGSADLELFLPRKVSLHVSSGDGRLRLEGLSGDISLRTGDGAIDVSNTNGVLQLNTGEGPIKVVQFEGQLDARTGDGPMMLDGSFTGLAARSGSGTVTLSVPQNSNFTLETNAEEVTNQGLNLTEDATPSRRVKRWKVGNGGKVFVVNTLEGRVYLRLR